MKILFFILVGHCLAVVVPNDSVAMESETNVQQVRRYHDEAESEEEVYKPRFVKAVRGKYEGRKNLLQREREARGGGEEAWKAFHGSEVRGAPVYELPGAFEVEGKYYEEPERSSYRYYPSEEKPEPKHKPIIQYETHPKAGRDDGESLKLESSQHPGSYLNHIKENMKDGKLLGFSSFVEHFSENDDAEELKTALREGSLDDIKKLVPKSVVSFQMYHGDEQEKTVPVKAVPVHDKKVELSWNEINEWHQPSPSASPEPYTPPQTHIVRPIPSKQFFLGDRRKRMRKHPERVRVEHHRPQYHLEESRKEVKATTVEAEPPQKIATNEVYQREEENYPQIVPSISFELPSQTFKGEKEYEVVSADSSSREQQDRQESQSNYHSFTFNSELGEWRPVGEKTSGQQGASEQHKPLNTPKPPETSKLYYEHFKTAKPFEETSKYSQLPNVGRIVVDQPETSYVKHSTKYPQATPETYHYTKKPIRTKTVQYKRPVLPSGEDFNHAYAQIPTATPSAIPTRLVTPQPTRYHWSKPDTTRDSQGKFRTQKVLATPVKLEKIINKQVESHGQIERPAGHGKENGNIYLTKEFQSELSDFFKGGKSDYEWVPSTQIRYDHVPHASNPVPYQASPAKAEESAESKPKRYRIYRSERNVGISQANPKNVILLGPEEERNPGEFSVSASYKIDKNRKSDEKER